ncbi:MAG TPA: MFS transporter [Thermoanaerobaculia bacterium]|nr:MFS transporter [Thermoanaerobaculia bacterium]
MSDVAVAPARPAVGGGFRSFAWLWAGQTVSIFGSGLTAFALGVWVYQTTGSVTRYTLIAAATAIPTVLLSPFAGALVDRWNRRKTMLLADLGAALGTVALLGLLLADALQAWHIYLIVAVQSAFGALQFPAFSAATTLLIPKRHFGRASGMLQFGQSGSRVLAPLVAGVLISWIAIEGVIALDLATFLLAAATLLLVRIPEPQRQAAGAGAVRPSLWREAGYGWVYLRQRPPLMALLAYFALLNLLVPFVIVLATPMVLSFAGADELGLVLSLTSAGALAGGLLMSAWGGPERRMLGVLGFAPLIAAGFALAALRPSVPLIAAGLFLAFFMMPVINGSSQAIWQSKVAPEVQGRVFAMRRMVAQGTSPLAFLAAGPLADHVFEPLMAPGGALAGTLGPLLGTGEGRGIALLLLVLSALLLAATLWGLASPRLRDIESQIPDAELPG